MLLELEGEMSNERKKKLKECREEYKQMKKEVREADGKDDDGVDSEESSDEGVFLNGNGIAANVAVPSQEAVAQVLLQKKKEALLNRFN